LQPANSKAFTNIAQIFFDLVGIFVSFTITFFVVSCLDGNQYLIADRHLWILIIYTPVFFMSMYVLQMYHLATFNYRDVTIKNVLFSCLLSTLFCLSISPFIQEVRGKYTFLGCFILLAALILSFERHFSITILRKLRNKGVCNTILVGDPERIKNYLSHVKKTSFRYDLVGYVLLEPEQRKISYCQCLGTIEQLENILNDNVVDEVIFTFPRNYMGAVQKYLLLCEERGLTVKLVLDLFDLEKAKTCLLSIGTMPILMYHTVCLNSAQLLVKRILDIIGSVVGMAVLAVASVFIIPAIKLESKGPVLFKQKRVGQNGRVFYLYKFRSMYDGADLKKKELIKQNKIKNDYMFKMEHDPRVTKVGAFLRKTSLDELPQFINVFKGDMSLVGTRPPTLDEVVKYNNPHHRRISFKPGITGMWQISGRSDITDFDEVVRLDTSYIDDWNIWKDIVIIFKTIYVLLFKNKGAY
jgi:exopolysaccharide biosynthesis polyprenyl glycosylphosphotransferase